MQGYWIAEENPQAFLSYALDRGSVQLHVQTIASDEGTQNTHLVKRYVCPRGGSESSGEEKILCGH
jgi:hypothetical protein